MNLQTIFDDMCTNPSEIDVVILCGGLGRRLRSVFDGPKVLAKIGDTIFLDILIDNLLTYGFKNIILSVGYLRDQIKDHFNYNKKCHNYTIMFSEEQKPLGTGGALKKAKTLIRSNLFMVMNGDSICKVDLRDFVKFHIEKNAFLSIVLAHSSNVHDYGSVTIDDSQRITSFNEKVISKSKGIISTGIYLMEKKIFSYFPDQREFSLERDIFPKIINDMCYGFLTDDEFIDIGTPERYERAIHLIGDVK